MTKSNRKVAEQQPKMAELVCQLREIQIGLKNNLADLQQKLFTFDSEAENLDDLQNAKRAAEAKASNLEAEVKILRDELKAIKDLLGFNVDRNKSSNSVD